MAQKTAQVAFRWRPEVKAALERVAAAEDRSLSAQAERIVAEWLRAHGHLPATEPAPKRRRKGA